MKRTTFAEFWRDLQAEARAEGPEAVAQLNQMQHRYRLGGQLAMLRRQRGLSQAKLARITGVDQAEISRIERGVGNPTEDTLEHLGGALGVKLAFVPERALVKVGA